MQEDELVALYWSGKRIVCNVPPYVGRGVVYEPRKTGDRLPWSLLGTRYGSDEVKVAEGDK